MSEVVIKVSSAGLDFIRVQELVGAVLKRELIINLAEIPKDEISSAIGSVVLGRIAMREGGCFTGDFAGNAHYYAEAMSKTNHPELMYAAYMSARTRASVLLNLEAVSLAENFLRKSAAMGHPEAVAGWVHWPAERRDLLLRIIENGNPGEG